MKSRDKLSSENPVEFDIRVLSGIRKKVSGISIKDENLHSLKNWVPDSEHVKLFYFTWIVFLKRFETKMHSLHWNIKCVELIAY